MALKQVKTYKQDPLDRLLENIETLCHEAMRSDSHSAHIGYSRARSMLKEAGLQREALRQVQEAERLAEELDKDQENQKDRQQLAEQKLEEMRRRIEQEIQAEHEHRRHKTLEEIKREAQQARNEKIAEQLRKRQEHLDQHQERIPRVYILEPGEQPVHTVLQESDIAISFTENAGSHKGFTKTEGWMIKNRWGDTGPIEIIEHPAR